MPAGNRELMPSTKTRSAASPLTRGWRYEQDAVGVHLDHAAAAAAQGIDDLPDDFLADTRDAVGGGEIVEQRRPEAKLPVEAVDQYLI